MTITTDRDLDGLAARLGVVVCHHRGGEKGRFYGDERVSLRVGLGHINRRCTLAHELGHHVHGHIPGATGWLRDRQERQADEFAARLLISPVEYRMAETLHGPHVGAIAQELEVTTHLVKVWRQTHGQAHSSASTQEVRQE